ncbi:MAG: tetratricopeptide repeat protein [Planctomycetes bacterium]|nr:tetratricopeptide repeat protein [Planctomycetota bacterium]
MKSKTLTVFSLALLASCATVSPESEHVERAREFRQRADAAVEEGHLERAVSLYTRSLEENPQYAEAWWKRGNVYTRMADLPDAHVRPRDLLEKAIDDYSRAIHSNPAFFDAYFNRAMVGLYFARYREAARDLLQCLQIYPRDPQAHLILGRLYEDKFEGRLPRAMEHYEQYLNLGGTDEEIKEKVQAWREFKKSIAPSESGQEAAPKKPAAEEEQAAQDLHGRITNLIGLGRRDEAYQALEELLSRYGHTRYVKDRQREFEVLRRAFKPK